MGNARPRASRAAVLGALLAALTVNTAGCKKDPIKILDPETTEGGDFGRAELLAAARVLSETPTSGEAYSAFADKVAELRPRFDKTTGALADRLLAFLAIGPLSAHNDRPADEQLEMLASTVWPSALGPPAKKGEDGRAYIERICAEELASECTFMVPEYWPLLMGAKVWRRFRFRAQESFAFCRACQADPSYRDVLRRYDDLSFAIETLAAERKGEGHPREWPQTDATAVPWDDTITTLEISRGGSLRLSGREVSGKHWRDRLKAAADGKVVGLYLRPDLSVARLRDYLKDLGEVGFEVARLQVRLPEYPYELRYYPLATKPRRGAKLETRSTDTIQVMVLAAKQATTKAGKPTLLDAF